MEWKTNIGEMTISKNPAEVSDYKLCPLLAAGYVLIQESSDVVEKTLIAIECNGPRCAWWDAMAERCAVLSLARNK